MVDDKILYDHYSYQFFSQSYYQNKIKYIPISKRKKDNMDQKEIDYFDNSKRVFDYPYFGDFESVKKDLFFVTEDFSLN